MNWSEKEFKTIDLGDKRLNKRAFLLAERLSAKPGSSIPAACGGWAETQAAYRFFAQDEVEWSDILKPHMECTRERMQAHEVVLCIQDTTELNFNGQAITGLGPLNYESQRGMYVHPTYAVSLSREPLGILDAWMWAREPRDENGQRAGLRESLRWVEGYQRIAEYAEALPNTRLVYVADREADFMELLKKAEALGHPADWLIRSKNNRRVPSTQNKLWDEVKASDAVGEIRFTLPRRGNQKAREVHQQVRVKRVRLSAGKKQEIEATCIIAQELNPPESAKPVEWRLLTNRKAETFEDAVQMIDWYRARWEIELFFHVLKNGCQVEALQLSTIDRLEIALALYFVVAWRINRLMRLGRACPDLEAELLFDPDEWRAAYVMNKKKLPKKPPSLNEVLRLVAMLGGFLGRKSDGEPGVKTLWLGMQRITYFALGLQFARVMGLG